MTTYSHTALGQRLTEVKGNGNTVDYDYFLDGLLARQVETKANGMVVSEHVIGYDLNGNRDRDVARTMKCRRSRVSLDGYVADEDGTFDWAAPDE